MESSSASWHHRRVRVGGLEFHYVEAGRGPAVLLLHGFPEFWYSWRHQIPFLASAGFRVLALDLRGYNETDKPAGVEAYRVPLLVEDLRGFLDRVEVPRAHVVGHDWGGVLAWKLAQRHPERVQSLVVLNAPNPAAYRRELSGPGQLLRSWYVFFFQCPWLPEWWLRRREFRWLETLFRPEPGGRKAYSDADLAAYKTALKQPGALTAALNYYRAAVRFPADLYGGPRRVSVPTLLLWGKRDRYLDFRLTRGLNAWVPRLTVQIFPHASHWLQNERSAAVNQALARFFQQSAPFIFSKEPSG